MVNLDLYRYDDVGEGAMADERLATLLIGGSGFRFSEKIIWLDVNQFLIAVFCKEESRVACSCALRGDVAISYAPVGGVSRGKL